MLKFVLRCDLLFLVDAGVSIREALTNSEDTPWE